MSDRATVDFLATVPLLEGREETELVELALGRLDFAALLAGQLPSAFRLKRRLASLFTARLRNQLRHLAVSLGGEMADPPPPGGAASAGGDLEDCRPPDSRYVRRMAT